MGGNQGEGGGGGGEQPQSQKDNQRQWLTEAFRHSMARKLEEAIRSSGNSTDRKAEELEREVFSRANTKEEYLGYVARLILHVRQMQPSPGMPDPSPSSVNTPMSVGQEDREYLEKIKSLEKYIEPLRNMIAKIGNEEGGKDRLTKMKKLLDILSNPGNRMPIATLQKCEDVLKRMALDTVDQESGEAGSSGANKEQSSSRNPLLEAVIKIKQSSNTASLNHSLSTTFMSPAQCLLGSPIGLPPLPASPSESEEEEEIPDVLQGEIARLEPRFKVWLSPSQPAGETGAIQLVCQLEDKDLPTVPHINVTIPANYPQVCQPHNNDNDLSS